MSIPFQVARFTTKELSAAGLIASLYVILSMVFMPISFGVYQIRVAEALTVLPFLTWAAIPGLFVGCLLANILGGMGWLDITFGPLITLVAAFLTRSVYHLSRRKGSSFLSLVPIVLMWAGGIWFLSKLELTGATVVGFLISLLAYVVVYFTERRYASNSSGIASSTAWLRILAVFLTGGSVFGLKVTEDIYMFIIGSVMTVAAILAAMVLARIWFTGNNANMLIAPLPPVVLNAFGVSAYLAPLIGVNYWFSVQMVGVGQLIACYVIGLPVLLLLHKRKLFF